jgi:hypothetical protein
MAGAGAAQQVVTQALPMATVLSKQQCSISICMLDAQQGGRSGNLRRKIGRCDACAAANYQREERGVCWLWARTRTVADGTFSDSN